MRYVMESSLMLLLVLICVIYLGYSWGSSPEVEVNFPNSEVVEE